MEDNFYFSQSDSWYNTARSLNLITSTEELNITLGKIKETSMYWETRGYFTADSILFSGKFRMIVLILKMPGTKQAKIAVEHCEKLGFSAWYE